MTEARKSNSPLVLGFQGRSQLAKRYGLDAEAMLSQPATKIFLRTSEPDTAKWISQTLGDVETERLKQSRSSGDGWPTAARHSTSYALERHIDPLVMASEIMGLEPLRGDLKLGNLVVRLNGSFVDVPDRQPAFIERLRPRRTTDEPSIAADPGDSTSPRSTAHGPGGDTGARASHGSGGRTLLEVGAMLTISKPLSAGQAQRYHADEFQNARDNYYTVGDQIRGEWHGQLAAQWGLHGEVHAAHFRHLARGPTSDHRGVTRPPPDSAHPYERAWRDRHHNGASRRLGRDVFGSQERVTDRARGRG